MTKEIFENIEDQSQVSIDQWFEFYKEKGGGLNEDDFSIKFSQMKSLNLMGNINGSTKYLNIGTAFKKFYSYYQEKFKDE